MTIDLKAIRERDAKYRERVKCDWGTADDDRSKLLALVDQMREATEALIDAADTMNGATPYVTPNSVYRDYDEARGRVQQLLREIK